ncbi:MAG: YihA family ribosome biogenesis GTP-binding protein [Bdellovibrionales bacterium]|nr:YihA family ribosome biogenesis GTP-binding protein [Bdellovibrionales bacterium]
MNYRIISAEYQTSVAKPSDFADADLPEAAFVGRSNVGKSTLINALTGRKGLARTSKTPGRTRMLNYFDVRWARDVDAGEQFDARFVDIPGFGYAQVSKKERNSWQALIESYLFGSHALSALVVLIDARRGPQAEESMLLQADIDAVKLPVLTKIDKLNQKEKNKSIKETASILGLKPHDLYLTGIGPSKNLGIDKLREFVGELLWSDLAER